MGDALVPKHMLKKLPWDSDFFGFPVVRIDVTGVTFGCVSQMLDGLADERVALAYLYSDRPLETSRLSCNTLLVDRKVSYTSVVSARHLGIPAPYAFRPADRKDISILESLAVASGVYSRFRVDPRIGVEKFELMYRTWLRRSLSGEMADEVLVIRQQEIPVGLVTVTCADSRGSIGLLAVDAASRGNGLGRCLVEGAVEYAWKRNCTTMEVITQQDNKAACGLYERCGFKVSEVVWIYHAWLQS